MSERADLPDDKTGAPDDRGEGPEESFQRWNAVRARTGLAVPAGGLGKAVGFLRRTAGRVRDLGISADLQRALFRALLDRQGELDARLRAIEEVGRLTDRLGALEAELARLGASDREVRGALDELRARIDGAAFQGELANLRDRQETLRARQARAEGALSDLRELLAAARGAGPLPEPSAGTVPLSPRDLAGLLAALDDGTAGAVEVSFQDVRSEGLLLGARRHFGDRLAASGPSYRSPNDLWVHADFTAQWERPILLENAAARLAPGGRFLLVTAAGTGEAPRHPRLALAEDRTVALAGGAVVRVVGWRRTG
jgi:hypothetical protein